MSNQQIHISARTNKKGIVKIDVPTGIVNQDIQLVVSFEAVEQSAHTSLRMRVPGIDEGRFVVPDDFEWGRQRLPPQSLGRASLRSS